MKLEGRVAAITGGASGIGAAMARAFLDQGAAAVVIADVQDDLGARLVGELGDRATYRHCDVARREDLVDLVDATEERVGPIDLLCANAGVATGMGLNAPDRAWQRIWSINVMGIVHAADAYLPRVRTRGEGYLLVTASAAGLLVNLGDAPYTATKHAAVGLAEWMSITHADDGLKVSCLCPQGVRTPLVTAGLDQEQLAADVVEAMGLIEPEQCAATVVEALADERFLVLPHPEVADYVRGKAADPDRWLAGMRRLQRRLRGGG